MAHTGPYRVHSKRADRTGAVHTFVAEYKTWKAAENNMPGLDSRRDYIATWITNAAGRVYSLASVGEPEMMFDDGAISTPESRDAANKQRLAARVAEETARRQQRAEDARKLAAFDDLLDALRKALNALDDGTDDYTRSCARIAAREAIAKAGGA